MRVKTSELTRFALDWAVGTALKLPAPYWDGNRCAAYSSDWAQGGPIIERERISLTPRDYGWDALYHDRLFEEDGSDYFQKGTTPLIAAMRCYVSSKLGDEIDVPEELS